MSSDQYTKFKSDMHHVHSTTAAPQMPQPCPLFVLQDSNHNNSIDSNSYVAQSYCTFPICAVASGGNQKHLVLPLQVIRQQPQHP